MVDVNNGHWVPLQNFNGRFDGNGHTISNVYIDAKSYKESMDAEGKQADVRFRENTDAGFFAAAWLIAIAKNISAKPS